MKKSFLIFLVILAILACSRFVRSIGKSSDVVIIASLIDEDLIVENIQLYNFVPQQEGIFTFIFASDTALENYKKHHAVFIYGTLKDDFIHTMLNEEAREATEKDTFNLFKLNDLWAHEQTVLVLAVRDEENIQQGLSKYHQLIGHTLEENYYRRVKKNYYDAGISSRMKDRLKAYGMTIDINEAWMIDSTYQDSNFIYIHTHFPDRSIFYYKEAMSEKPDGSFAIAKRDSLTARFYNGDYILQELTSAEPIEFAGLRGVRVKGVWQNDSLIAGGPFLSYFLSDGDTLYIIDGIVFNPGERKTDHLTKIEVIMNSLNLIRS
ncbi:MAG: DUF4837 family protein [candidate division WOR-3 bacterium]|jgi:hypothetical protein